MVVNMILKQSAICERSFVPKVINSIDYFKKFSDTQYHKEKERRNGEQSKAIASRIPDDLKYISVPETVILC